MSLFKDGTSNEKLDEILELLKSLSESKESIVKSEAPPITAKPVGVISGVESEKYLTGADHTLFSSISEAQIAADHVVSCLMNCSPYEKPSIQFAEKLQRWFTISRYSGGCVARRPWVFSVDIGRYPSRGFKSICWQYYFADTHADYIRLENIGFFGEWELFPEEIK